MAVFTLEKNEPIKSLIPQIAEYLEISEDVFLSFMDNVVNNCIEKINPFFAKKDSVEYRIMEKLITAYFVICGIDCTGRPQEEAITKFPLVLVFSDSGYTDGVSFLFCRTIFTELYRETVSFVESMH